MSQTNPLAVHAFTTSFDGLTSRLTNTVKILHAEKELEALAQWDTGATGTCLSKGVIDALGLIPTGKIEMKTPTGKDVVNTYLVDLVLQNAVRVTDVLACESAIDDQGIDVLVGMDIILLGDFAISNNDGKTCFSFRCPSVKRADFVGEIQERMPKDGGTDSE